MRNRDDSFFTYKIRLAAKRYQVPNCIPTWSKVECLLSAQMPLKKINQVKYFSENPLSSDMPTDELQ